MHNSSMEFQRTLKLQTPTFPPVLIVAGETYSRYHDADCFLVDH